jgi:signal recognition particle subunit SRP54
MMEEMMQQLPIGGKLPDNISQMTEEKASKYEYIIDSMTEGEVQDPSIIGKSRRERIAEGSGTERNDVKELVKHYQQTKNMMDKFDGNSMKRGNIQNMMQKMGF